MTVFVTKYVLTRKTILWGELLEVDPRTRRAAICLSDEGEPILADAEDWHESLVDARSRARTIRQQQAMSHVYAEV